MPTTRSSASKVHILAPRDWLSFFGLDSRTAIASDVSASTLPLTLTQIAAALVFIPTLAFTFSALWLLVGGNLSPDISRLVLGISALCAIAAASALFRQAWRLSAIVTLGLAGLALLIASASYDTSIDGQNYQFQAIFALAEGWNPLWSTNAPPAIGDPAAIWVVHYPRATWLVGANILAAGFGLPAVKSINFVFLFAATLLLAATLLRTGFGRIPAALLTATAILNPVVVSQMQTGMNDGVFALSMLIYCITLASWIVFAERGALVIAVASLVFGLNLKFSAIPVFVVLTAFAIVAAIAYRATATAIRTGAILLLAAVFSIAVLGWTPYVQNYLNFGHVFHPLMGPNALDIMATNTPDVLKGFSAPERFLFSLFAETHAGYGSTTAALKPPFLVRPGEIRMSGGVDVRIGGFGPLFSGILVLALATAGALLAGEGRRNRAVLGLLFAAGGLLVSVLAMPENWWARYVPQFWYVPWCIALAALIHHNRPIRMIGVTVLVLMMANAAVVSATSLWLNGKRSHEVASQMEAIRQAHTAYCITPELAQSRIYLLRQAGVDARVVAKTELGCALPQAIAAYGPDREGGAICKCSN